MKPTRLKVFSFFDIYHSLRHFTSAGILSKFRSRSNRYSPTDKTLSDTHTCTYMHTYIY